MFQRIKLSDDIKQYLIVTGNYWAFTLTDGALRMLVVLYFHQLGYSPLNIALLFLFYEVFGVITNLFGGYLGAKIGLNRTMNIGLAIQIIALLLLTVPTDWLTVVYVMIAQALSGIAKDLNKMSAKSAIKMLVASGQEGTLFKWVAILTGSKNALKGFGFFIGGILLTLLSFKGAMLSMAVVLILVWCFSIYALKSDLGKAKTTPKFREIFSKSSAINSLSAARMFLFGARDVWFVVALPVFLSQVFNWDHWTVGGFLAAWVIGYGIVQSCAPALFNLTSGVSPAKEAVKWAAPLALVTFCIAIMLSFQWAIQISLIIGLLLFGVLFAINSSLHSYLIVSMADADGVSLDVGFYYMANAMGRLIGTILSGWVYQYYGLTACLFISSVFIILAMLVSCRLPKTTLI
ncbi:organoarsenical effux MFS transporter ArsJ [Thalassotalea sp. 1_MG-2023]|uniref:organoarsenical effux MFS transporter ArsJ n=1 Tax=Thalassotalea sp. 1_MG-2023 TaxID=3062680 RepID=UPI0026E48D3A|nr:organoarsenical effux MFS transporter ArsJ [Thalassotalea sp. 1_MG-2023]MDO6426686.1 organoarsenical effux MFS transporter ArsJ [Thalassotalea sp. 1_MG-2023]